MHRAMTLLTFATFVTAACTAADIPPPGMIEPTDLSPSIEPWPSAPATDARALDPTVAASLDQLMSTFAIRSVDADALEVVAASGDARLAWIISDMLRFVGDTQTEESLVAAFTKLTGVDPRSDDRFGGSPWISVTNLLIAWDLPAPPEYRTTKAKLFLALEPGWEPFFDDADSLIDWRLVSWGGVFIDDSSAGGGRPCSRGCIPALDDPTLTAASEGDWYTDDGTVFGIVVNDQAVAFPKHQMEVHEMVNITIGGRRIGMPYCTLCGAAQAYLTDAVPDGVETPVLRTSGLLSRSNKVMYDLVTNSVFNTFTGRALSGPLHDIGLILEQATVVVSTWGEWKAAHPDTRIVAQDGGIGRRYPDDPLGGRDANGPIFPIGQPDPRLPAQAAVVGVIGPDGSPLAFPVEQATAELVAGRSVKLDGITLILDGGGLRARGPDGDDIAVHEAFWFAWSQFHPETALWTPPGR